MNRISIIKELVTQAKSVGSDPEFKLNKKAGVSSGLKLGAQRNDSLEKKAIRDKQTDDDAMKTQIAQRQKNQKERERKSVIPGMKEETNTQKREKVVNVGRPDTAKNPFDPKSKLAKQAEIKTKIIDEVRAMSLKDFHDLPDSLVDAVRAVVEKKEIKKEDKVTEGDKTAVKFNPNIKSAIESANIKVLGHESLAENKITITQDMKHIGSYKGSSGDKYHLYHHPKTDDHFLVHAPTGEIHHGFNGKTKDVKHVIKNYDFEALPRPPLPRSVKEENEVEYDAVIMVEDAEVLDEAERTDRYLGTIKNDDAAKSKIADFKKQHGAIRVRGRLGKNSPHAKLYTSKRGGADGRVSYKGTTGKIMDQDIRPEHASHFDIYTKHAKKPTNEGLALSHAETARILAKLSEAKAKDDDDKDPEDHNYDASKDSSPEHIIIQLRKAKSLGAANTPIHFNDGSKHKVDSGHVHKALSMHTDAKKSADKEELTKKLGASHASLKATVGAK